MKAFRSATPGNFYEVIFRKKESLLWRNFEQKKLKMLVKLAPIPLSEKERLKCRKRREQKTTADYEQSRQKYFGLADRNTFVGLAQPASRKNT